MENISKDVPISKEKPFSVPFSVKNYSTNSGTIPISAVAELHNALESEQEAITNSLLKRLDQLKCDKIRIESELEIESENIMNKLTRELNQLRTSQNHSSGPLSSPKQSSISFSTNTLNSPTRHVLPKRDVIPTSLVQPSLPSRLTNEIIHNSSTIETLKTENNTLKTQLKALNVEYTDLKSERDFLKKKLDEICQTYNISIDDVIST
ncbi:hypothetical protein T552_00748 [Pneumocystis carinii B80]|uniref:Uncharacterized protein n=1 Tax=Pneumocystis carinii (strain B80) TaxID=1408658 RepID=A0A0W4ZPJ0_PNEC8|nr:hypothetical protein T552_00748 [Pneumocystis carinii B80]KTW30272.1 hypothetical protein T552_00748 [Pneumocystis carinii B80]